MADGKVTMVFTADQAKAIGKLEDLGSSIEKQEKKLQKLQEQSKKGGKQTVKGLDDWKGKLIGMAAGYGTLASAIGVATAAVMKLNEERKRGASSISGGEEVLGQLAQVAGGSKEKLSAMMAEVNLSRRNEGMSLQQAAQFQFALESSGKGAERANYARFAGIADPAALVESVSTMQAAMPSIGTDQQAMAKLFAASAVSKTSLAQFAPSATTAAGAVSAVGGTDIELLATLAQLSKSTKSADQAGTQISAFATMMSKRGLSGSMVSAAEQISGMGLKGAKLQEYIGSVEAQRAYQALLTQGQDIRGTMAEVSGISGNADQYLGGIVSSRNATMGDIRIARIAAERRLLKDEELGNTELKRQALQDDYSVRAREQKSYVADALKMGPGLLSMLGRTDTGGKLVDASVRTAKEWGVSAMSFGAEDKALNQMLQQSGVSDIQEQNRAAMQENTEAMRQSKHVGRTSGR